MVANKDMKFSYIVSYYVSKKQLSSDFSLPFIKVLLIIF